MGIGYTSDEHENMRLVYVNEPDFIVYETKDIEDDEEPEKISVQPFNPDDISISVKKVSMDTIVRRLEQKKINFSPDFQRSEVWDEERKSRLIESLMLNIPIPMYYIAADENDIWTVVDGLQRLSTIRDFVVGKRYLESNCSDSSLKGQGFKLCDLEFWPQFNGYTLNQLPSHLFNRIMETEFNFTIIDPRTPEDVKRNIFKRINTGGLQLSSQEIRNALYPGKATDLLKKLAKSQEFINATQNSIKVHRMEDRELILRFVAFIVRDFNTYKTQATDDWLSDTMLILNSAPDFESKDIKHLFNNGTLSLSDIKTTDIGTIENMFHSGMARAFELFGKHSFRRSYGKQGRKPINKSLFETWGVILSNMSDVDYNKLLNEKNLMMHDYQELLEDDEFILSISRDSMKKSGVKYRFCNISNLVQRFI